MTLTGHGDSSRIENRPRTSGEMSPSGGHQWCLGIAGPRPSKCPKGWQWTCTFVQQPQGRKTIPSAHLKSTAWCAGIMTIDHWGWAAEIRWEPDHRGICKHNCHPLSSSHWMLPYNQASSSPLLCCHFHFVSNNWFVSKVCSLLQGTKW